MKRINSVRIKDKNRAESYVHVLSTIFPPLDLEIHNFGPEHLIPHAKFCIHIYSVIYHLFVVVVVVDTSAVCLRVGVAGLYL